MTGSLQEKSGKYFIVLNAKRNGKRKQKWIATGLDIKGNKRQATKLLNDALKEYDEDSLFGTGDMLFSDYMMEWLEIIRNNIRPNTYEAYKLVVEKHIVPYFKERNLKVDELNQLHIQKYYNYKLKSLTANSVLKHHANIHKALKYAVNPLMLIKINPADNMELPKKKKYKGTYYNSEQLNDLLEIVKDSTIEVPVVLTANYGFRRSEVLGLRWKSIDFKSNVIYVEHTAVLAGSKVIYDDETKTKSSNRALPLTQEMGRYLKHLKKKQLEYKLQFGNCYFENDYICKWEDGRPMDPNYLTHTFKKIIDNNNLPPLRFHDLRHSSASMLLSMGFSLKEIQEWLGHGDIGTTANIYAHLQFESKKEMANRIEDKLKMVK